MKEEKLIQTKNGIKTALKRIVKKFGDGAHISLPKKYIGKEAEIYIKEEVEEVK